MSTKKILMLAGAGLAALVLVVPASASDPVWRHGTEALNEHVELSLSGTEVAEVSGGVLICGMHATLTTEGGNTAQITAFQVTKQGCLGVEELEGCSVEAAEPQGLPWDVHVNATNDLTVTGVDVRREFDAGCPIDEFESTIPALTLTPDDPANISVLEFLEEEGDAHSEGSEVPYSTFGSLQINGEDAGTYGIG